MVGERLTNLATMDHFRQKNEQIGSWAKRGGSCFTRFELLTATFHRQGRAVKKRPTIQLSLSLSLLSSFSRAWFLIMGINQRESLSQEGDWWAQTLTEKREEKANVEIVIPLLGFSLSESSCWDTFFGYKRKKGRKQDPVASLNSFRDALSNIDSTPFSKVETMECVGRHEAPPSTLTFFSIPSSLPNTCPYCWRPSALSVSFDDSLLCWLCLHQWRQQSNVSPEPPRPTQTAAIPKSRSHFISTFQNQTTSTKTWSWSSWKQLDFGTRLFL